MIRRALALSSLLLFACACGQKGPLKLPEGRAAAGATSMPQPTPATPQPAAAPPSSP